VTLRRLDRERDFTPALVVSGLITAAFALPLAQPLDVPGWDIVWMSILCLIIIPVSFALITIGPRYLPAPDVQLLMLFEMVLGLRWTRFSWTRHCPGEPSRGCPP
ncbi:MAG TPA: hypothetical protein VFG47_19595, partial [Geminicoccaceae bacterium]|nr:hypothetical protein [Geminicoccaceae bacterium]